MIEVRNLSKTFKNFDAVSNLNFQLKPGKIYAFVGPNGAGKTTTMRMIATLEEPTCGEIFVDGMSTKEYPYEIRKIIGYMPDHYGVYPNMNIRDYLEFYSRAYEIPRSDRNDRINAIMEFTGLDRIQDKYVTKLSKGMMQRLNMGRALLNNPKVLILDEPAAGLDPRARIELRYLLKQLSSQGKTIFISSHILSELAEMSDEMLIIDKGKQVSFGKMEDLQNQTTGQINISVRLFGDETHLKKLNEWLLERPEISNISPSPDSLVLIFTYEGEKQAVPNLLKQMVNADIPILEFRPTMMTMEEIFMQITESDVEL